MNSACSTCLESFTSRSDISTIICGHVFHTDCIGKWLQSGRDNCPQCRKSLMGHPTIKLYFSESQTDNGLVKELEETIQKLQDENKVLQEDANESKSLELTANYELAEQKLKFQEANLVCRG